MPSGRCKPAHFRTRTGSRLAVQDCLLSCTAQRYSELLISWLKCNVSHCQQDLAGKAQHPKQSSPQAEPAKDCQDLSCPE